MKLLLLALTLNNFKAHRDSQFGFDGESWRISGKNGLGKTTVADAFSWCLFGRDTRNQTDFDVKLLDSSGTAKNKLEHFVTVTLNVNGKNMTFQRLMKEKWTTKRGSNLTEYTGHDFEYRVDGVPRSKAEFELAVASILDTTLFRVLSEPLYFPETMKWKDRRQMLTKAFASLTDEEIVQLTPELAGLPNLLDGLTTEDKMKMLRDSLGRLKASIEAMPGRIAESLSGLNEDLNPVSETELAEARSTLQSALNHKATLSHGGAAAEAQVKLTSLNRLLGEKREELTRAVQGDWLRSKDEIGAKKARLTLLDDNVQTQERSLTTLKAEFDQAKQKLESLRQKAIEIKSEEFQPKEVPCKCPACGQSLPEEDVQAASDKWLEEWNLGKANRIDEVNQAGRRVKESVERLEANIQSKVEGLAEAQKERDDLKADILLLEAKLGPKPEAGTFEDHPDIISLTSEIAEAQALVNNQAAANSTALASADEAITAARQKVESLESQKREYEFVQDKKQRSKELEAEHKKLLKEQGDAMKGVYLIELFWKTRARLLTEQINKQFEGTPLQIKLFEDQINGGVAEVCEITWNGVPWSGMSTGERVKAGLILIRILGAHHGVSVPVFVDNAESVDSVPDSGSQQLHLYMDPIQAGQLKVARLNETQEEAA